MTLCVIQLDSCACKDDDHMSQFFQDSLIFVPIASAELLTVSTFISEGAPIGDQLDSHPINKDSINIAY